MVATGMPFNRIEDAQGTQGIPLPASTRWELVADAAEHLGPAHQELIRQAAQGEVAYNDDTTVRILELMGQRRSRALAEKTVLSPETRLQFHQAESAAVMEDLRQWLSRYHIRQFIYWLCCRDLANTYPLALST